jgi:hypothetical protein
MHDAIHPHGANVLALINNEESFYPYPMFVIFCYTGLLRLSNPGLQSLANQINEINALLGRGRCKLILTLTTA